MNGGTRLIEVDGILIRARFRDTPDGPKGLRQDLSMSWSGGCGGKPGRGSRPSTSKNAKIDKAMVKAGKLNFKHKMMESLTK
jgi:hypothetical protein